MAEGTRRRPARRWGTFPTTADVGIWASGPSAAALLEGLGHALTALIVDPRGLRAQQQRTIRASGQDPAELAVAFLGELLLLQESEGFLARRITVRTHGRPATAAEAELRGEPFDAARHRARTEVKAITYHDLRFEPRAGRARVIVDL